MRTKLVTIVAILWVAAVVAISVAFYASRDSGKSQAAVRRCLDTDNAVPCINQLPDVRSFEWGGWLAWTGAVTLAAVVVLAIILVLVKRPAKAEC